MNFEPYGNPDAFLKMFCFPDTRFDGHNVATIFGKHGSLPLRSADPSGYRNHSPAIRYKSQYGLQVAALFRRNGDEVPGGGAAPVPNLAAELDIHYLYQTTNLTLIPQPSAISAMEIFIPLG